MVANTDTSYYPATEHKVMQSFMQITPATPLAILLCILAIMTLCEKWWKVITKKKTAVEEIRDKPAI